MGNLVILQKTTKFLIKWKGFDEDNSTWERKQDLFCEDLLKAYWKSVGSDETQASSAVDSATLNTSTDDEPSRKKFKRLAAYRTEEDDEDQKDTDEEHESHHTKLKEIESDDEPFNWDQQVDEVVTAERREDGVLIFYLRWSYLRQALILGTVTSRALSLMVQVERHSILCGIGNCV